MMTHSCDFSTSSHRGEAGGLFEVWEQPRIHRSCLSVSLPPPHIQKRTVIVKKLLRFSCLFCLFVYFKINLSIPPREISFNSWHKVMVAHLQDQESKPPYLVSEAPCSITAFSLCLNGTLPWSVRMLRALY